MKVSTNFFGSIGWWRELPRADTILHNSESAYMAFQHMSGDSIDIESIDTYTDSSDVNFGGIYVL